MSDTTGAPAWANCRAWTVLDGAFDNGQHFLAHWSAWRAVPHRQRMLHYVGFVERLEPAFTPDPTHPLAKALLEACKHVQLGFNRIALEGGHLSLTLCVGESLALLDAQDFQADHIIAPSNWLAADKWVTKALARCCKRGTHLTTAADLPQAFPAQWAALGFQACNATAPTPGLQSVAVYEPPWTVKRTRHTKGAWARAPGRCVVVGAGLSGAAVAHALALRGWQVQVIDQCAEPAGGASGLPVGLVVPHVSADDSPRSRLSRAGARMTLAAAREHLRDGEDWALCGVTEMRLNPGSELREPLWHAVAGWIKPAALVRAWLQTPGVAFQGQTLVARLAWEDAGWQLYDADGQHIALADQVVLANAMGCQALLQGMALAPEVSQILPLLHAMYGTLTMGRSTGDPAFPRTPVNGLGSFVPAVPSADGDFWAAGATFETRAEALADREAQHSANLQRLQVLLPETAIAVQNQRNTSKLPGWSGERCVTHDRLPWVGPVALPGNPGLWVCAGMGSRGLSFAALCAEFLAARLGGEPLPLPLNLVRNLDINRLASRIKQA